MIDAIVENVVIEEPVAEPTAEPIDNADPSFAASQEPVIEEAPVIEGEPKTEPVTEDPEAEPATEPEPVVEPEPTEPDPAPAPSIEEQVSALQTEHADLQSRFSTLETDYAELQSRFDTLETAHAELVEFKRQSDDAKKDEMIGKFYMLSDEDKAEVIANKANYTVEDIEEKLSVICFRKKVNFELEDNSKNNIKIEQPAVTFNMSNLGASKPAWLQAVDNAKHI